MNHTINLFAFSGYEHSDLLGKFADYAKTSGYLANLLDCDGSIFIDRDPAHFPSVLAWLRDGQGMALPESDAARRVHIAFFSIGKLAKLFC